MAPKKLIAPSILSADFGRLAEEIKTVEAAGADVIHVDVMDGHFVPNITVGPVVVEAVRKVTTLPIDVHLMIENPQNYVANFVKAGATWISIHAEEGYHLDRTLNLIKDLGVKAGVVLNPATPVTQAFSVLGIIDFVLLMTVNPGFGGQKFIPYCKEKIKILKKEIQTRQLAVMIEIDGGVKTSNIGELSVYGADVFVAGSAIFESGDYKKTITEMKKNIA
jgi:ribulose-phosphate 3-epimerase